MKDKQIKLLDMPEQFQGFRNPVGTMKHVSLLDLKHITAKLKQNEYRERRKMQERREAEQKHK